jgi:NAD(P)-dependent dehydrogenase (short-subunit alcohol dehydrogenase family)
MHARCVAARHEAAVLNVLSIAPGTVRTAMTETLAGTHPAHIKGLEKFRELSEQGGLVQAEPVAQRLVSLLLDPQWAEFRTKAHGKYHDLRKPDEFL